MLKVCFEHFENNFLTAITRFRAISRTVFVVMKKIALSADAAYATFKP